MPRNNQTLIAMPPNVADVEELRQFLVKLIVALDVLIGYRGSTDPDTTLVTQGQLQTALDELQIDIKPLNTYNQTISPNFVQSEIQDLSDAVTQVTDKVNELINIK